MAETFTPRPSFQVHPFKEFVLFILNDLMVVEVTNILSKCVDDEPNMRLENIVNFLRNKTSIPEGFGGYRYENLVTLITKERHANAVWKALTRNEEELERNNKEIPPYLYSLCTQLDRILEDFHRKST